MNTKLKCLLLDDELPALSYLKIMCEQISGVEVVKAFNEPEKFLSTIKQLDFNVCILDIQMPGLSGLEIAQHLKDKLIIFTTAHKEFAAEAFDLNAVDYIRKPIQKERFEKAIAKAFSILRSRDKIEKNQALLNTDKGREVLNFNDILYITSSDTDSRDKFVYLLNGTKTTLKNIRFDHILSLLPPEKFCRINKKDVIALKSVKHFTADEINLYPTPKNDGKITLSLSEVYREEFKQKFRYIF